MLLAHAVTLAEARSHIAALADRSQTLDASVEYERALLQLDWIHGDDLPGLNPVPTGDLDALFRTAESAVEALVAHGIDALQIELVLDMLCAARDRDAA